MRRDGSTDFSEKLRSCPDEGDVLRHLMRHAALIGETANATTQLVSADFGYLDIVGQLGFSSDFETHFQRIDRYGGSVCARTFLHRAAVAVEDVFEDEASLSHRHMFEDAGIRGVLSVPVMTSNGSFFGVVSTLHQRPGALANSQLNALIGAARLAADAIVSLRVRPPITSDRASWRLGQRVSRKKTSERGTVIDVADGTIKVKWDGGATSIFKHGQSGNVQLIGQESR
jgi:GAF domain-containing protein